MKINEPLAPIVIYLAFALVGACKKTQLNIPSTTSHSMTGRFPIAYAGNDVAVQLPVDSVILYGGYSSPTVITRIEWKKLSGPSCQIVDAGALTTKVAGLQEGIYEFELTVTNALNRYGKDTTKVRVFDGTHMRDSVSFDNLTWIFPWYNSLEVPNIHSYVPQNVPMRVYIKRSFDSVPQEAYPLSNSPNNNVYEYFIETRPDGAGTYTYGSLYIFYYGTNVSDKPSVKIIF